MGHLPTACRDRLARLRDVQGYFVTRQRFGDNSVWADAVAALRSFFGPQETILFFPERPPRSFVTYKLCALLGHAMTMNPKNGFTVAFKRKDTTIFDQTLLQEIPRIKSNIVNAGSIDISKQAVAKAFADVFGYPLEVDPTQHHGRIVEKSDTNATHDGRIIQGPISADRVRAGYVYQRVIDNASEKKGLMLDYRVPIHGDQIPLVYLKYRPMEMRFSNENAFVRLQDPGAVFSQVERDRLLDVAGRMGLDYGEFDVLRDTDERIYVVDVSNTPAGPPNGLPDGDAKVAMRRMVKSFDLLLDKYSTRRTPRT
jgi:hypothetical protein